MVFFTNPGIALSELRAESREDKIEDNLTVLSALAQQVAEDIVNHLLLNKTIKVFIDNIPPTDESSWLLETKLLPLIIAEDIAVSSSSFSDDSLIAQKNSNGFVLEYKITKIGIEYDYINRGLFRENKVQRIAVLSVFVKLSKENGSIILSEVLEKNSTDTFFSSQLKQVNNPDFSFTFSEPPASFGVKKLIEPLIAIGVTGTIIYLFYSFRSK